MFTETDFRILDSYKSVLDGLAAYLGDGYEIVLHSLHDLDHSVIKIINGHYTGRREGFPITDLALSMLAKIEERPDTNCITYFNRNQKGEPLKSATIVIRNHSRMAIGLLCINFYMNTSVFQFLQSMTPPAAQTPDSPVEESYVENVDELIVQAVTEASQKVQNDSAISNANKKQRDCQYSLPEGNLQPERCGRQGRWPHGYLQEHSLYACTQSQSRLKKAGTGLVPAFFIIRAFCGESRRPGPHKSGPTRSGSIRSAQQRGPWDRTPH